MRSLKKTLTLVLVFVMAIGLLTAGALDFTDADDIQYKTAVEVMTGIGAISGYPDGTFRPDGLVTRAEAAKLVTYAILTPQVAEYLPKGTSSFTDVPATHWAAPYIEYCVSRGIINGRGNGKFDPNGNVTAFELAKMLLTAAGYGKNNEYVGASWQMNVVKDAIDNEIFLGSKATNYGAPATREEAALYVFNAMSRVDQVNWDKNQEDYVSAQKGTIGWQKYGLFEFPYTVNGVSGSVWVTDDGIVSSFVPSEKVLGTSMNGTAISKLLDKYDDAYIASPDTTIEYYYNGFEVEPFETETAYTVGTYLVDGYKIYRVKAAIAASNTDDIATLKSADKVEDVVDPATKGVIVNLVDSFLNGKVSKITIIEKKVAKLSAAPTVVKGKVTISDLGISNVDEKYVPGYADLAKDDVVLWYKDATGYFNIEKAESVTGTVTAVAGAKYYIDGTLFELSGLTGQTGTPVLGNTNSTYYLDNAGYIAYIVGATTAPVTYKYALVLDYLYTPANTWAGTAASSKAKLLFADGTVGIVDLVTNNGKVKDDDLDTTPGVGGVIKYVMNDNGVITSATAVSTGKTNGTVTNKAATATFGGTTYYVSSSTVFFFYVNATNYGVAVGFANVPTTNITGTVYVDADANNVLQVARIPASYTGIAKPVFAYITNDTPVETIETVNGAPTVVYTYDAYVNGVKTTVKSLTNKYDTGNVDGEGEPILAAIPVGIHTAVETNGYYELTPVTPTADKAVTVVESTYFVAGGTLYNITPTTEIYKATKVSGAVVALEKADLALVAGKTLKVDVVADGSSNAQYVIFWYENN